MAYDYRMIYGVVREALEEKAAREMGVSGAATAAEEVAAKTMELFSTLRAAQLLMAEINEIWLTNDISTEIGAAALAGAPLAGYSPAMWAHWGALLPVTQAFLGTEYSAQLPDGTTVTETPRQTLGRRYTQEAAG